MGSYVKIIVELVVKVGDVVIIEFLFESSVDFLIMDDVVCVVLKLVVIVGNIVMIRVMLVCWDLIIFDVRE